MEEGVLSDPYNCNTPSYSDWSKQLYNIQISATIYQKNSSDASFTICYNNYYGGCIMVIEGTVKDIKFRNEDNGYTVGKLSTEDGEITIVGHVAIINIDEMVTLEGELIYHNRYGEQFSFTKISTITPSTIKGIENFLSNGLISGIGPQLAKRIVDKFQEESLNVIQYNPERLKEVKGIGDKKLKKILASFDEHREIRDMMVYLQQFDISTNLGIKIYKAYGSETISVISKNPYQLTEDVHGIGFKIADKIAYQMGIDSNNPYRIKAGLKFTTMEAAGEGHCYLKKEELFARARRLLNTDVELLESSLRDLALSKSIYVIQEKDETLVYYAPYYTAENNVAKKVVELSTTEFDDLDIELDKEISKIEADEKIKFGNRQILAIKESLDNGVLIITGGPGTGKTTIINAIIKLCDLLKLDVSLTAPTGRAAKRMTETTGMEAKTIHRLLEISFLDERGEFVRDDSNVIDGDVLIVDEASMIDILLMNNLLKAVDSGTRLILVGDIDQLPSVGPGNVLKDLINSKIIRVVMLDEIFRQQNESMIIENAHRINNGKNPYLNVNNKDFFFIKERDLGNISNIILDLISHRLPDFYNVNKNHIQVLTPMKKGEVGINNLNNLIQERLNPKSSNKPEKKMGEYIFRLGDKVMQIKNNYNAQWEIIHGDIVTDKGEGVFNGDLGYIHDINNEDSTLQVMFDDEKLVEYEFKDLDELKLAYAITVHKSQGSEFPIVIMPMSSGVPMLLTRNLLYTAVTRAKELVVLVGMERYMHMMINNNLIAKRYSSLDDKIKEYFNIFR